MVLPGLRLEGPSLQIDRAALAASIGELHDLDLERGLTATLQEVVLAARTLFGADGAGLMLADADGELRWASATDQQSQLEREGLDAATAHERLRTAARSSSRKVADVAGDLLAGAPFPPAQP